MSKKRKKRLIPGVVSCIFCGSGDLSDEHLWPQWMRRFRPSPDGSGDHFTVHHAEGRTRVRRGFLAQNGHRGVQRKLPCVCKSCNNGWMSRLQTEAMPVVERLIAAPFARLNDEERAVFARWAGMGAAVGQYATPEIVTLSQRQRELLRAGEPLAPTWRVGVGRYEGRQAELHWHRAATLEPTHNIGLSAEQLMLGIGLFTTGLLSWLTFSANHPAVIEYAMLPSSRERFAAFHMREIWPEDVFDLDLLTKKNDELSLWKGFNDHAETPGLAAATNVDGMRGEILTLLDRRPLSLAGG